MNITSHVQYKLTSIIECTIAYHYAWRCISLYLAPHLLGDETHAHMHKCTYEHMHTYTHAHTHIYTCIHVDMYTLCVTPHRTDEKVDATCTSLYHYFIPLIIPTNIQPLISTFSINNKIHTLFNSFTTYSGFQITCGKNPCIKILHWSARWQYIFWAGSSNAQSTYLKGRSQ